MCLLDTLCFCIREGHAKHLSHHSSVQSSSLCAHGLINMTSPKSGHRRYVRGCLPTARVAYWLFLSLLLLCVATSHLGFGPFVRYGQFVSDVTSQYNAAFNTVSGPRCPDEPSLPIDGTGKVVLVTGAAGFIGSHVARYCAKAVSYTHQTLPTNKTVLMAGGAGE